MLFFKKEQAAKESKSAVTATLTITNQNITPEALSALELGNGTELVIAFISPHNDFKRVSSALRSAMPFTKHIVGIMTAGELGGGDKVYHDTPALGII